MITSILRRAFGRHVPLRRCPLCASDAVATLEYELVDRLHARVLQQCGQCGVWRQTLTAPRRAERHKGTLGAHRHAILRCAERLTRDRARSEAEAFAAALRDR